MSSIAQAKRFRYSAQSPRVDDRNARADNLKWVDLGRLESENVKSQINYVDRDEDDVQLFVLYTLALRNELTAPRVVRNYYTICKSKRHYGGQIHGLLDDII